MTNYGDFGPSSSISIEGTNHSSFHQHQNNQNWILLNKHETLADQANSKRILYHKPIVLSTTPSTSAAAARASEIVANRSTRTSNLNALQRMESVNRLNERIRRKLESNNNEIYASTSIFDDYIPPIKEEEDERNIPSETSNRRVDRVIDDSFRFISDENGTRMPTPNKSNIGGFGNNSNIDRRPFSPMTKKPSNYQRYHQLQQQQQQPHQEPPPQQRLNQRRRNNKNNNSNNTNFRSLTDPLLTNARNSHQNSMVFDTHHQQQQQQQHTQPSTSRGEEKNEEEIFYDGKFLKINSSSPLHHQIHNIPIKMIRRRADSLDSGSLRLNGGGGGYDPHPTPLTASDWQTPAISRHPSISHQKRESFLPQDRRLRGRGYPSFSDDRYEPPSRRISQIHRRPPYRRPSGKKLLLPRKTPSLLRRDSYYYKKCDICLNEERPDGIPCYACNNYGNPIFRNPQQQQQPRRITRSEYLHSNKYPHRKQQPPRIPSTSRGRPSQLQPPPPVTIEPYFEEVDEESGETSSNSSAAIQHQQPLPRSFPHSATIPPRTPPQNGFYRDQKFNFSTSPRRQQSNRVLSAEGLQKHPSYLAYRRPPNNNISIPTTYIPQRAALASPNQQSRQSTVIWPSNAGPAWKSIDPRPRANPSPIFRYGKQVPKWLYDYDAYAEEQKLKEMKQRRRKVFAIIVVFLLFALVVAAGVVLAAIN